MQCGPKLRNKPNQSLSVVNEIALKQKETKSYSTTSMIYETTSMKVNSNFQLFMTFNTEPSSRPNSSSSIFSQGCLAPDARYIFLLIFWCKTTTVIMLANLYLREVIYSLDFRGCLIFFNTPYIKYKLLP